MTPRAAPPPSRVATRGTLPETSLPPFHHLQRTTCPRLSAESRLRVYSSVYSAHATHTLRPRKVHDAPTTPSARCGRVYSSSDGEGWTSFTPPCPTPPQELTARLPRPPLALRPPPFAGARKHARNHHPEWLKEVPDEPRVAESRQDLSMSCVSEAARKTGVATARRRARDRRLLRALRGCARPARGVS